jgi:hypothetical protein
MIQQNELVMMFLGIGVLVFILSDMARLKLLPYAKVLITSFGFLSIAWVLTVLEGFFLEYFLNLFEHICYFLSAAFLFIWSWKAFNAKRAENSV